MFCPKCGSMVFPQDGKYICKQCEQDVDAMIDERDKGIFTKSEAKEIVVNSDETAKLPKTRIICEKCGHTEAYYYMRQNRSADEPETIFYRCAKCNHQWKE